MLKWTRQKHADLSDDLEESSSTLSGICIGRKSPLQSMGTGLSRHNDTASQLTSTGSTQRDSAGESVSDDEPLDVLLHPDDKDTLIFQDGHLICGSIEALTQHLVPTATYFPDRSYVFAFLLSSRLFVTPQQLLDDVHHTCVFQQNLDSSATSQKQLGNFGGHLLQLLTEWTEMFPFDFRESRTMSTLRRLTQRLNALYPELRPATSDMVARLHTRIEAQERYEALLERLNDEMTLSVPCIMPETDVLTTLDCPHTLAQQLTHIELERLHSIGPEEFVQSYASESTKRESEFNDCKTTNNLEAYAQWFNRFSYFVASQICMQLKKKARVRVIEFFIDVAKECFNLGNFNSLMAIIAGLNLSAVRRLKKTWAKLDAACEKLNVLENQMAPKNNFSSYRSTMKAALWRYEGATDDTERIIVPFFSLLVKDMYFLNAACASLLSSGHVNFEKFWHFAKQMKELLKWKKVQCPFDQEPDILNFLLTSPVFSEQVLEMASYECEAPETGQEKEHFKKLRASLGDTVPYTVQRHSEEPRRRPESRSSSRHNSFSSASNHLVASPKSIEKQVKQILASPKHSGKHDKIKS